MGGQRELIIYMETKNKIKDRQKSEKNEYTRDKEEGKDSANSRIKTCYRSFWNYESSPRY